MASVGVGIDSVCTQVQHGAAAVVQINKGLLVVIST
jgi:hypothetical protein